MEQNKIELGSGNKLIWVVDLDNPYSVYEKNKLAKMDSMADFIWDIQHNLIFNKDLETAQDVFSKLLEMMKERNLNSEELTF